MREVSRSNAEVDGNSGGELDLSGVGAAIWRARRWIALATLVCAGAAIAVVSVVKPRYTAEAKALV